MADTTSRGAPYPEGTDPNDAPGYIQDLAEWVNDRPGIATLTTTARNALAGVELWAGRHIWNTTTGRLEYYNGTLWLPTSVPGRILGECFPATATITTSTSPTVTDADATNLKVTFTAPASESVWVELSAFTTMVANVGVSILEYGWALREGVTVKARTHVLAVLGPGGAPSTTSDSNVGCVTAKLHVSGLTPGASYTWKWAHYLATADGGGRFDCNVAADMPASMVVTEAAA